MWGAERQSLYAHAVALSHHRQRGQKGEEKTFEFDIQAPGPRSDGILRPATSADGARSDRPQ
jgi:hypothetical protein